MATIHISRNKLKAAAIFAASKDVRYYLCGILIESTPLQTRIVATDGHAMFCAKDDAKDDNAGAFTGIVPNDTIKQILAWKAPYKTETPVIFTTNDDPAGEHRAEWAGNTAVFKLIDAKFPEYARVVPALVQLSQCFRARRLRWLCLRAATKPTSATWHGHASRCRRRRYDRR